ncbi:MAG: flagellar biosynthetic protein FliQ [Zetaproteobacteria bacterium]|nr:MAG: flagellar biosynthetic protein FliQ [Zetaproteobacteria bacterium]
MNDTEVIEVARQALLITMQISAPILIVGLVVGVAIALLQALTQIQEMTLVFVPKIMAIFFSMFIFLPWMMNTLVVFMEALADRIISGGGG